MTFLEIDAVLINGWKCTLISYPTSGVVRIQMANANWDIGRHYEYGTTLEEAVLKATAFSARTTPEKHFYSDIADWEEDDESWRHLGDELMETHR